MDSATAKQLASLPEGAEITVHGYVDSKGVKTDKRVVLRGAGFYAQLLQDTITWLQDKMAAEDTVLSELGRPHEVRVVCMQKLQKLQEKTVAEARASDQVALSPCVFMKGRDTVYLKNIEYAERPTPCFEAGDETGNVQKAWPLARYNVQLKLVTNYDSISVQSTSTQHPMSRYTHLSLHLTAELWQAYVINALRTEPLALKLLNRWDVVQSTWNGESYEQMALRVPVNEKMVCAGQHLVLDISRAVNPLRMLHAAVGIATELEEMRVAPDEDNYIEELGDACWYLAQAWPALFNNVHDFESILRNTVVGKFMEGALHDVISDIKRLVMYGKDAVLPRLRANYCCALIEIDRRASESQAVAGLRDVLEKNSHKLLDPKEGRYASGAYSDAQAIERRDKGGNEN